MTIIKTKDLIGAQLDWAAAKAINYTAEHYNDCVFLSSEHKKELAKNEMGRWSPSTDWVQGGKIIHDEMMGVMPVSDATWRAGDVGGANGYGPTPLIAAMRCYVAANLGDEVEIPAELA